MVSEDDAVVVVSGSVMEFELVRMFEIEAGAGIETVAVEALCTASKQSHWKPLVNMPSP